MLAIGLWTVHASLGFTTNKLLVKAVATALLPASQGGLGLRRGQLFIQTKFTTPAGHQLGMAPYLVGDAPDIKVKKSLAMSMRKLQVDYIDSLLLHGPMPTMEETFAIWAAMESVLGSKVRQLGISNVCLEQLGAVYDRATIKPSIVQNRFWRCNHFDSEVRSFCAEKKINYQAFWVLTGNPQLLDCSLVGWFAEKIGASREDGLFNLVLSLGQDGSQVSVLNGTTNPARMRRSLEIMEKVGVVPDVLRQGFKDQLYELANAVRQSTV